MRPELLCPCNTTSANNSKTEGTSTILALSRGNSELGWRAHHERHLLRDVLELAQKLIVIPLKIWAG